MRKNQTNNVEDCLYLNVFKPIVKSNEIDDNKALPIMVFYYGSGFQSGTIFDPVYDATFLADLGKVIVVTVNYRLGPLGFLYAGTDNASGNQGLYDQITSLEWIRDNINSFGGNPNQVTIFGQSAGSTSVSALILSPVAKGLFQRAIMQSGVIVPTAVKYMNKEEALAKTIKLSRELDCTDNDMTQIIYCLLGKTIEEIKNVYDNGTVKDLISNKLFGPIFDDEILPEDSVKFEHGFFNNKVDILFGLVSDEGSMFIPHYLPELMDYRTQMTMEKIKQNFRKVLSEFNVNNVDKIIDFYAQRIDPANFYQVRKMFADFFADLRFNCPVVLFAKEIAKVNPENRFYAYRFDRLSIVSDKMHCYDWMGVCHGSDILYTFSHPFMNYYPPDARLSHDMIKSWTKFARTGQPGPIGPFEWPKAFDSNNNSSIQWMLLDVGYRTVIDIYENSCEHLWRKQYVDWFAKKSSIKDEL
nr:acetylcholinesterase-like [Dermatophagoides farinae]